MFSKEMEALIEATLQDGVLTDQEKAVLVKRAQREGIDVDELDVYIQSLLQKRHQAEAAQEAYEDRASKIGSVRRCPNCGYNVPSGFAACPQCGQTFNVVESTGSWQKLQEKLDKIHIMQAINMYHLYRTCQNGSCTNKKSSRQTAGRNSGCQIVLFRMRSCIAK
jgi:hypothetical protein